MRVVVDTNVLVRALIKPHGTVGPVLLRLRHAENHWRKSTKKATGHPVT
jgi:predicted nucleic acid-binding protein